MLGQFGFLAKVFTVMAANKISVDVVATSEVSVSLTLDPSKLWSRDLQQAELEKLVEDFEKGASPRGREQLVTPSYLSSVTLSAITKSWNARFTRFGRPILK